MPAAQGFTSVFGGSNIAPAIPTFTTLTLTSNVILAWPMEQGTTLPVMAQIVEVTSLGAFTISLSDARQMSQGYCAIFNNVGSLPVTILDAGGDVLMTVPSGQVWQIYLSDNTTQNGTWRVFQFGAGVSTAQAAALAGLGLKAIGTTLNARILINAQTLNYTLMASDRASCVEWTGGSGGTLTLPVASAVGADWFCYIKNSGTGLVTLSAGTAAINGAPSQAFNPNDSAIVLCDGTNFFTVGLGQSVASSFNFVTISLAGATGTVVLSGAQLNRISYKFTGALAGNTVVQVPASIQQYWVDNETTGSFTLTISCGAGSTVAVPQGGRAILYCDGGNIVNAITTTSSAPTFPDGVPGNPSITFTSDLTLGLFKAGADVLGFATAGVQRGQIGATGLWGLNAPAAGTTLAVSVLNGAAGFALSDGVSVLAQSTDTLHAMYWGAVSAHDLNLTTSGLSRLLISAAGNFTANAPDSGPGFIVNMRAGSTGLIVTPADSASVGFEIFDPSGTTLQLLTTAAESIFQATAIASIWTGATPSRRLQVDANGGVTIFAPSVGVGLKVTGPANNYAAGLTGSSTVGQSYGLNVFAGTTTGDAALWVSTLVSGASNPVFYIDGAGVARAVDQGGALQTIGWRDMPAVPVSVATTLALAHRGEMIVQSAALPVAIPPNSTVAFPVGAVVAVANRNVASIQVTISSDALFIAGTSVGGPGVPRTLSPRGLMMLIKVAATEWWCSGSGVS